MAKDRTGAKTAADSSTVNTENTSANTENEQVTEPTNAAGDKLTPTGKVSKKGQPVPIGKRRALGLATRALMAEVAAGTATVESPGYLEANEALSKNEYTELRPQAERLADVQLRLQAAIAAGDGTTISKLGKELNRIKMGL